MKRHSWTPDIASKTKSNHLSEYSNQHIGNLNIYLCFFIVFSQAGKKTGGCGSCRQGSELRRFRSRFFQSVPFTTLPSIQTFKSSASKFFPRETRISCVSQTIGRRSRARQRGETIKLSYRFLTIPQSRPYPREKKTKNNPPRIKCICKPPAVSSGTSLRASLLVQWEWERLRLRELGIVEKNLRV